MNYVKSLILFLNKRPNFIMKIFKLLILLVLVHCCRMMYSSGYRLGIAFVMGIMARVAVMTAKLTDVPQEII